VITGLFNFKQAAASFLLVILLGVAIGLVVGIIFYAIQRWLPTTTRIEIILSLVTPYCMYYFAEHFHVSGVLAVVSGGLFLSSRRNSILNYKSRLQGVNVWTNLVFVLNGIIFLLIGLQLPSITHQLGSISLRSAIGYGLAISLVLIVARMLCTFGIALFTRIMSHFITVADPDPGWKSPTIIGWAGMRGVVSLAAALSIPVLISSGHPFPYRNLILFITFIVILVTLVFQGLTLPWLIRKLKPEDKFSPIPEDRQELIIQKKIAQNALRLLEGKYDRDRTANEHLSNLHERLKTDHSFFSRQLDGVNDKKESSLKHYQVIYLELLEEQRKLLKEMNQRAEFDEELIRKYLSLTDLDEFKVREKIVLD
jgi:CPA1 family monovalent cation:H+ antiporter